jgi:hypothetical protein
LYITVDSFCRKKDNAESAAREKLLQVRLDQYAVQMKSIEDQLAQAQALKNAEPKRADPILSNSLLQQFAGASAGILYV